MYPIYHFALTLILSGFLWPILGWKVLLLWLGSFFIDIDHYWWYIIKFKDLSLKKAYIYGKKNKSNFKLHIFHTIEFWILLGIWSLFSELAFVILFGIVYHNVIDLAYVILNNRYHRIGRAFSFLGWYYFFTKVKTG